MENQIGKLSRLREIITNSSKKISKSGTIVYPSYLDFLADYIGRQRRKNNDELYDKNPNKKRGEHDKKVHPLGVKGELIASWFLYEQSVNHELNGLLEDKPVVGPDIFVNGKSIDVKTIRPDGWDLLVTKSSHDNQDKKVDSYFFIQLVSDHYAKYWIFKHDEVSQWQTKVCKGNGFENLNYYKPISELK